MNTQLHTDHSVKCLAQAVISTVENFRDELVWVDNRQVPISTTEFCERIDNHVLAAAAGYLADGLQTCTCHVEAMNQVKKVYEDSGSLHATALASKYLREFVITPTQYLDLVRWSEGRD